MSRARWFFTGLVASCFGSGCGHVQGKPVIVFTTIKPTQKTPAGTPLPTATTVPGEVPSQQDHGLVVTGAEIAPARLGKAIHGHVINRGQRDYGSVHLKMDFLDARGKVVGSGSDFTQLFPPGSKWWFYIKMPDEAVSYKVTDLSGN